VKALRRRHRIAGSRRSSLYCPGGPPSDCGASVESPGRKAMSRSPGLWTAMAGAAVAALAVAGTSPASAQTIKIGLINSYSGFLAQAGDEMEKGINLYIKEHQKDLPPGIKIEIIRRDDAAAPEVGKRVAQELITRDRVQLLVGVVGSPIAAAVAPLTAEAKIPLVITNAAGTAIPRISPYVVRVSFTLWQQAYPLGKWAAKQNWKTAYTAVS